MDDSDKDDWDEPLCFNEPRHLEPIKGAERVDHSWRVKEKYKTHCVALVLCLNVGVDPPDVVKTQPCARLECWIDPNSLSPSKALESIGHALQAQYERWQPRARYKQSLDPTSDEVKKLCCSLRRNAKDERVLFHYNGHGVPRPTAQGEIWVFNRAYTQYIPLSMYDLQTWMGAPSLYVYDCSNAGVIIDNFQQFAEQHERDYETALRTAAAAPAGGGAEAVGAPVSYRNCIQLAACAAGQSLPMSPELPADLFTACLTTPVKMAMKWFVLRARTTVARPHNLHDLIDKIPGQVTDRRTMLGELNWIFTAITDTIAWSSLPPELFQQLFRADLLTASLCRNFLLADRIMRSYNCTPVSMPALPSLAAHPLWAAWEYALDLALAQLPALLAPPAPHHAPHAPYAHSPFFRDQLTAFTVWLDLGSCRRAPPEQLPMVLQVLLSTLHRVRALHILCRFLALGAWAVRAVLRVGIFPYMLKLLQASAPDLRASMVYIWAKIIAQDPSCQVDLVNAKGHKYFLSILQDSTVDCSHRTMAAYVLAGIVDNCPAGQEAALQGSMISICLEQLQAGAGDAGDAGGALLKQWACVALGRVWRGYDAARWSGVRDLAHEKLYPLLQHPVPEVRAACAFALGTFMGAGCGARSEHALVLQQQVAAQLAAAAQHDASPVVRAEILAALQWPVLIFEQHFMAVYFQERMRRSDRSGRGAREVDVGQEALPPRSPHAARSPAPPALALPAIGFGSVYARLWGSLAALAREPHPQVARMAADLIAYIANLVDNVASEPRAAAAAAGTSSCPDTRDTRDARDSPGGGGNGNNTLPTRRKAATLPHAASAETLPLAHAHAHRHRADSERDSTSSTSSQPPKKAIVHTEFVEWAWAQFGARGVEGGERARRDVESRAHHERAWRRARNRSLRRHAHGLREAHIPRLDTQVFNSRCALPPCVVLFHPYEQHIAVANKDNFGIWDWGTAAKLCLGGWRRAWGRISALAYLNAHERALLAAASHSGNLAIYRPAGSSTEPALVGAWRALEVRQPAEYRPPSAQPIYSLAQLVSEQFACAPADAPPAQRSAAQRTAQRDSLGGNGSAGSGGSPVYTPPPPATLLKWVARRHSLALAGHSPHVRLWDARSELLVRDIPTESEAAVTALWRGGEAECEAAGVDGESEHLLVAGLADGAVRAWDERAAGAPTLTLHHHTAPVLCAARRPDLHTLVTGCMDGVVHIWDTRRLGAGAAPTLTLRAPPPLAAVACHPLANLLACGSVNQCISIYELKGGALNTIKFHEGVWGARIGPVSTLTFHPLRCALGVGSKDSSVCVYEHERR